MKLALFLAAIVLSGLWPVAAQDVIDEIRKAGAEKTIGTTPEDAFSAGELGFPALRGKPYWMIKHTFVQVTQEWNKSQASRQDLKGQPPVQIADDLRNMVRNRYLHAVQELWPKLNAAGGYSSEEVKYLQTVLVFGDTDPSGPPQKEEPNPYLAKKLRQFYDDWLLRNKDEPTSVFERLAAERIHHKGAEPLLTMVPDSARFTVSVKEAGGAILPQAKVTMTNTKAGLFGDHSSTRSPYNPCTLRVPCATFEVSVENPGFEAQKETLTFKDGAAITREFELKRNGQAPVSTNSAYPRLERLDRAEVLREHYRTLEGARAVVEFPVESWLARLQTLPSDYSHLIPQVPGLSPGINIFARPLRDTVGADGTGGLPGPAYNDTCLNIKVDFEALQRQDVTKSVPSTAYVDEIARAVVAWANLSRANTSYSYEPLGAFTINSEFYTRAAYRALAETMEGTANLQPPYAAVIVHGQRPGERQAYWDYVQWIGAGYDRMLQLLQTKISDLPKGGNRIDFAPPVSRENSPGPRDEQVDLTIRFVPKLTKPADPDSVAIFYNVGTAHQGVIEVLVDEVHLPLPASALSGQGAKSKRSFFRIILHEMGHYFGMRHLVESSSDESNTNLHAWLEASAMATNYGKTSELPSPLDIWLLNQTIYKSLDVNGRVCAGLVDPQ